MTTSFNNKRAMVVAHPDDETLWGGGLILRHPGDWTIICCSIPRRDPVRAEKFQDACRVLGATPRLIMETESEAHEPLPGLKHLDLEEFGHIVTHGAHGEYGHDHHKQVHAHVTGIYGHKRLSFFGFRLAGVGHTVLVLKAEEVEKKLLALKCYNHICPSYRIPKWEGLLKRYKKDGYSIGVESYDGVGF